MRMTPPARKGLSASPLMKVLALFTLAFLTLSILQLPAAKAADGRDLSADLIKTAEITRSEGKRGEPLKAYEGVSFKFTWNSSTVEGTDKAPKAGDYIKIDAPQWLRFTGAKVAMKDPNGEVVANCVENPTDPTSVTCTFTDYVEENPANLKGEYSTVMSAGSAREVTDKTFKVGPIDLNLTNIVDQDASGQIVGRKKSCHPLVDEAWKAGGWEGPNKTSDGQAQLWWAIYTPGTGGDITITDTLSKPQKKKVVVVYEREGSTEDEDHCNWFARGDSPGGASTPINDKVDISWSTTDDGEEKATVTIPNSEKGKHYRVVIWSFVPADAFKYNSIVRNEAFVNDQSVEAKTRATKVTNASASGNPDLGGVWVYKALSGDAKSLVPSTDSYKVKATWTQDGTEHTEELTVKPGETPAKLEKLPKGTEVTLSELQPADTSSYSWGDPVFADGKYGTATSDQVVVSADKQSAVVTIKGGENWPIQVTNTATKPKVGKFSVTKSVDDPDAVAADKTFTFNYTCTLEGQPDVTGTLDVKAGETATSEDMPEGYECVVKEDTDAAEVDGATLTTESGDPVTIVADKTVNTTVKNTYSRDLTTFTVTKKLEGSTQNLPEDLTFDGTYTVTTPDGQEIDGSFSLRAGETFTSEAYPTGSTVKLNETKPTAPANIAWDEPDFSVNDFVLEKDTVTDVALTNTAHPQMGEFSVVKELQGTEAAKALVPDDASFTFDYTYPAGPGFDAGSGTLTVKADGEAVTSDPVPVGAEVTLTEQTPEAVEGLAWGTPTFTPETFTVEKDQVVNVEVANPVTETLGKFSIVKNVSGDGSHLIPEGTKFSVAYTWQTPDGEKGDGVVDVVAGGDPVVVDSIPGGATVTLTENEAPEIEGVQWLDPQFSDNGFSVIAGETVAIDLDNPTQLKQGAFAMHKRVDGSGASKVPSDAEFTVHYSYPAGEGFEAGEGTMTLKADGTPVQSPALPYGAVVSFDEATPVEVDGAQWKGGSFSADTVTVGDGTVAEVVLTNTYDDVPPPSTPEQPTPGTPEQPTPGTPEQPAPEAPAKSQPRRSVPLPRTGAEIAAAASLGALLVGSGAAVSVASRRRSNRK